MKEIVERSGLSKGAFYHYFVSKEQLFEEIIDVFFLSITQARNDNTSKISLQEYYSKNIETMNDFSFFASVENNGAQEEMFSINFFSLIFDALKMFPEFRTKMDEYHEREFANWISVIQNARQNGEIKTIMDDVQIARLFIFAGDGLTLNLTLKGNVKSMKQEIKMMWDKIYEAIKV